MIRDTLGFRRITPRRPHYQSLGLEMLYFSVILCRRQCFIIVSVYTTRGTDIPHVFSFSTCFSLMGQSVPLLHPVNFFVFHAVRVISKESSRLVIPRTSCSYFIGLKIQLNYIHYEDSQLCNFPHSLILISIQRFVLKHPQIIFRPLQ
jgi:hypothetical protein